MRADRCYDYIDHPINEVTTKLSKLRLYSYQTAPARDTRYPLNRNPEAVAPAALLCEWHEQNQACCRASVHNAITASDDSNSCLQDGYFGLREVRKGGASTLRPIRRFRLPRAIGRQSRHSSSRQDSKVCIPWCEPFLDAPFPCFMIRSVPQVRCSNRR